MTASLVCTDPANKSGLATTADKYCAGFTATRILLLLIIDFALDALSNV